MLKLIFKTMQLTTRDEIYSAMVVDGLLTYNENTESRGKRIMKLY